MNVSRSVKSILVVVMAVTMTFPMAALAASGKKYFKEGMKYEAESKWDMAAEQFALAMNKEPSNAQYRLHYLKSLTFASLMFMERGRAFEEQRDYVSAYQAYRQAYSYDRTNEMAMTKMKRMYEAQIPQQARGTVEARNQTVVDYDGNLVTRPAGMPRVKPAVKNYEFRRTGLKLIIDTLTEELRLNVLYDQDFKDRSDVSFKLDHVTAARALELLLSTNKLFYSQADLRTLIIVPDAPQNRARYQDLYARTFYLKNADITEVRTTIQQIVGTKWIAPSKNLNALTFRDTPANLTLIENIINSIDKAPAEVLIDVNMYEVSRSDLLEIGNAFLNEGTGQASLSNLGGFFQPTRITGTDKDGKPTSSINSALLNATEAFINGGPAGIAIAVPSTAIKLLQSRGNSKLLNSAQIRAFENQKTSTRIGQRVPIQTASVFPFGTVGQTTSGTQGQGAAQNSLFNSGFPQIQYQDVGLVLDITPKVNTGGDVQMQIKVESTGVVTGPNPLTPIFTQRLMEGTAQTLDGQTAMISGVLQTTQGDSRKGLPLIGLIPVLGNFFTVPQRQSDRADIIVTVTPHILRGADIEPNDNMPRPSGQPQNFESKVSLQEIVDRADESEYAERKASETAGAKTAAPGAPPTEPKTVTVSNTTVPVVQAPPEPTPTAGQQLPRVSGRPPAIQQAPERKPEEAKKAEADDEGDDDEEPPAKKGEAVQGDATKKTPNEPVQVVVKSSNPEVKVKGQSVIVTVIIAGANEIKGADLVITYNTEVLQLQNVRDGGLLRAGGVNPEIANTPDPSGVEVRMSRPADAPGAPTSGLLLVLVFEPINVGDSEINVDASRSSFSRVDGQSVILKVGDATKVSVKP